MSSTTYLHNYISPYTKIRSYDAGTPCEIKYENSAVSGVLSKDHVKVGDFVIKDQVKIAIIFCS